MTENITSISDPTVSFKVTEKLVAFYKKHKKEMCKFKIPIPKNILEIDSKNEILLKISDIEWLNEFLKHKRKVVLGDFEPLTGKSLDKEIYSLLHSENIPHVKREQELSELYLHELLDTSTFLLPKNEVIPRNPVLEARIERLKKEQEERDYKAMTRNIQSSRVFRKDDTVACELNMMNRHLIAVGQFIVSVGAGFAFGFLGVEYMIGNLDFGFRLLLGIACALTIALAEFYFLAKHLSEEETVLNEGSGSSNRREKPHKD
ncbi:UNVERIFIED_CONTAM: hypothetical protein PYX00_010663 [Menopon gallinae]|uniref:Transmembrane protein 199 n=1 Tax=Menopon gallinae TaxID=328185 RepID=A0AAW2HH80_9NEOP